MVTMATLMAANTPTRCSTNQMSIPQPSTTIIELNALKYSTCSINSTSYLPQSVLHEIPTRNSPISPDAAAVIFFDDNDE